MIIMIYSVVLQCTNYSLLDWDSAFVLSMYNDGSPTGESAVLITMCLLWPWQSNVLINPLELKNTKYNV